MSAFIQFMSRHQKILSALSIMAGVAVFFVMLLFGLTYYIWNIAIDNVYTGLKEGVTRSEASDCPVELPANACDIYYAYEVAWQGGGMILRYHYPHGDIKSQAATHLDSKTSWVEINSTIRPTVPEHPYAAYSWFQPETIVDGYESAFS